MRNHTQVILLMSTIMVLNFKLSNVLFTAYLSTTLIACAPTINNRGFDKEDIDFSKIMPGVSRKEDVQQLLGSPTSVSTFNSDIWYYISKTTSNKAFLPANTLEQSVMKIQFGSNGIVEDMTAISGDKAWDIKPIKKQTPSAGHETSVLREVFSNFGKLAPTGKRIGS